MTRRVQQPGHALTTEWLRKIHAAIIKSPKLLVDDRYRDIKLRLSPARFSQERALLKTGRHPIEDDLAFFDNIAHSDVVFVDIGANAGLYSLVAANLAGAGSRIVAVEPEPGVFLKLTFQVAANALEDRISAYACAIGEEAGELPLYRQDAGDTGQNSLVSDTGKGATDNAVMVPVRTLLDVIEEEGHDRIDLLKIDVEGAEDQALVPFFNQAPRSLWPRDVLLEIKEQSKWRHDLLGQMQSAGYQTIRELGDNSWLRLSSVAQRESPAS